MTLTWIFIRPIVLAVLVVATQSSSPVVPDEKGRWGYPRTSSLEPVEHVLMGHRFRIPKAYLYLKKQWAPRIPEPGNPLLMEGSLPGIAPYSKETAPLHKDYRSGYRQIVHFSLRGIKYGIGLDEEYFEPRYLEECRGKRLDFRVCRATFNDDEILVQIDGEKKIAFKCSKDGTVPSPHCEGWFPLIDNVAFEIRFSKPHLGRAGLIIAGVYEVICGFHVPDANIPLTYNYCEKKVYHGTESKD
ncbi:MAG: hypothetical protein QGI63_08480 [Rhodospirillales bacterium]|nr:hypothetical protein [Rhodospirillales bacterium]MDP6774291.1 hypothetical protein [Rhodospirillales bacterium]